MHKNIISNIKNIVDAHKSDVECSVGSTSDILQKAKTMSLH